MNPRIRQLIKQLTLQPHPEGGWFSEVFRSSEFVRAPQGKRTALTAIYFLLPRGEISRWHDVKSDEVWHHIEGAPLKLHTASPDFAHGTTRLLGPLAGVRQRPLAVVAAHDWQAAETTGDYSLVACDVGPGFDFVDFRMLRDVPEGAKFREAMSPRQRRLI